MMEQEPCPFCKAQVPKDAFYCPYCGKKIREKPPGTGVGAQILLYLFCILLPPLNIPLSLRYIRSTDAKAKKIGWFSVVLMIAALVVVTIWTINTIQEVNRQVELEMSKYLGL